MRATALVRALLFVAAAAIAASTRAQTVTVTNVNDSGSGSLRQAILDANGGFPPTLVTFAIPGSGVHTISLLSSLPSITAPMTVVDGFTEPGASPNTNPPGEGFNAILQIEIDGTAVSGTCLTIEASNVTVQGLAINRCPTGVGVYSGNGASIIGNFLGTDPTGTVSAGPQLVGLGMNSPSNVLVAGNLISGNSLYGVDIFEAFGVTVTGNLIGTNAAGTGVIGGTQFGVRASFTPGVTIGGTTPVSRNVISLGGSNAAAIQLDNEAGSIIEGNFLGTDVTGTIPLGNGIGVDLQDTTVVGCKIVSNVIGAGTVGVKDGGQGTVIQGSFIGTDASATKDLGNSEGAIRVMSSTTTIGGADDGQSNVIAHNGRRGSESPVGGVQVDEDARATIGRNQFFDNYPLGIDLLDSSGNPGISPDDACDADSGGNFLQNFPIITQVIPGASTTHIEVYLNSTASTSFEVDLYAAPCSRRAQDSLQGETYLGTYTVSTDASCVGTFFTDVPMVLQPGQRVTATATNEFGATSEFSQGIVVSMTPRSGPASGSTAVNIGGMFFAPGSVVTIGGVVSSSVYVSDTQYVASTPLLAPGSVNDLTVTGPTLSGTLRSAWVADFLDVPPAQQFHDFVDTLVANEIAAGVGGGNFGVANATLRQQMAVFLLKGEHGICYMPPACTGIFSDVPCPSLFGDWIEALSGEAITGGCGGGQYCPQSPVRRDQMAAFLLKAEHGSSYLPPACHGVFADVACPSLFADWIEQLYAEGVTGGCGTGPLIYCPSNPVTRGQMSVFLTKTFQLN